MSSARYEMVVPQRRDALRTASRHSSRVRFLRRFIIIGASVSTAFIVIIAAFDPFKHLPISFSVSSVRLDGTKITTADPKLTGFRKDGRAYQVNANSGIQDLLDTNVTDLVGVRAKVTMGDNSVARVYSGYGVHDSVHDTIKLRDSVHILNANGYEFFMKTMAMDFKSGDIITHEPATLFLNGAKFDADSMTITENGNHVTFEGSVKSIIDQDSTDTSVGRVTAAEEALTKADQ